MNNIRVTWLSLRLSVLIVTSCSSPPPLGPAIDGGDGDGPISDGGSSPLILELLAGDIGGYGDADGTGSAARFNGPTGVTVDSIGNIYVADTVNNTIRKVSIAGVVTTLAGTSGIPGSADDTGLAARFNGPTGVTVDSAGNVYVADRDNHTIRKISPAGVVTTLAGRAGMYGSADGPGTTARFNHPAGVTVDSAGNVYLADRRNHTIRKVSAAGVTTLAGTAGMSGSADGPGTAARFNSPAGVTVDSAGNVYVADHGNNTVRKVSPAGVVTTLAGTAGMCGSLNGAGATARFCSPTGVAVDSAGNVYVADTGNHTIRKITATGTTTTIAGIAGVSGILLGTMPRLAFPRGLAIVGDSIVISDQNGILLLRQGAQ